MGEVFYWIGIIFIIEAIRGSIMASNEISDYKATQKKFARLGYTETIKDGYHFFYGEADESNENDDLNHSPFVLADREYGFYEQLPGAVVDENEKTVSYDFTEGDQDKTLILNIAKDTFLITDAE